MKKPVYARDFRDGTIYEFASMADAINACIHDWSLDIIEESDSYGTTFLPVQ